MNRLRRSLSTLASTFSSLLLALVLVLKSCPPCPACMPKYAALFSFLGLPLAHYNAYLMPLMAGSLLFTVGSMAWQGPKGYGDRWPALLAALAAALIAAGGLLPSQPTTYLGMATLLAAVSWHQWRLRVGSKAGEGAPPCCSNHKR